MEHLAIQSEKIHNYLARLRRHARARGFRILKDWAGTYSLVDTKIEPPRALDGLVHVPLAAIGVALTAPLPAPKPKRVRRATAAPVPMARLDIVQGADQACHASSGNGGGS